jgi:hypothetical protein
LPCALAILALLGLALASADGGDPAAAEPAAAEGGATGLDPEALARISVAATPRVARRVEAIRELEFDTVPEPEVVSAEYLNRLGLRELERSGESADLGAAEAAARMLGLIDADEQLEPALESTGDLAAAAYDPRSERLYVVEDAVVANRALVEFLLAHELNHALEDQRFGLRDSEGLDDDAALAETALIEGTATAVMVEYARHLNPFELLAASGALDAGTGAVPDFVVDQLTWTYVGGERFVQELWALAGGWKVIDYALGTRPPASTEQVLHPRKYVEDERPLAVRIDAAALGDGGWERFDGGRLGELTTADLLRLGDPEAARKAARGWGGDRYELWRHPGGATECADDCRERLAIVVRWRWDSAADAREAAVAADSYAERGLGATPAGPGLWKLDGGAIAVAGGAAATTLVMAPTARAAAALASAQEAGG